MKVISTILLVVALAGATQAQKALKDTQRSGLIGKVRTLIEREARVGVENGAKREELRRFVTVTDFDKKGRKILVREYGTGWLLHCIRFGNIEVYVREPLTELEKIDISTLPAASSYPPPTNVNDKSMPQTKFVYDSNGKVLQIDRYRVDGTLIETSIYSYDEKGRQIEWRRTQTLMPSTITYKYDERNNKIEAVDVNEVATSIMEFSGHKFDNKGNWTEYCQVTRVIWKDKAAQERYERSKTPDQETKYYRTIIYY